MRKHFYLLLFCGVTALPLIGKAATPLHQQFIQKLNHAAQSANEAILSDRKSILDYYAKWQKSGDVHWWDLDWLQKIAQRYAIKDPDFQDKKIWQQLLRRVDIIPPSMVIAQAAVESDWGRSRFATEANNYFGQHCIKRGCGLVPKKRTPGEIFEVERFSHLQGSVRAYTHMLNTKGAYKPIRTIRAGLRAKKLPITGSQIASGLNHYSEHPQYISIIKTVINRYGLEQYDQP